MTYCLYTRVYEDLYKDLTNDVNDFISGLPFVFYKFGMDRIHSTDFLKVHWCEVQIFKALQTQSISVSKNRCFQILMYI